jgi:hypothetical protein
MRKAEEDRKLKENNLIPIIPQQKSPKMQQQDPPEAQKTLKKVESV